MHVSLPAGVIARRLQQRALRQPFKSRRGYESSKDILADPFKAVPHAIAFEEDDIWQHDSR
jgi:hypothetical protein